MQIGGKEMKKLLALLITGFLVLQGCSRTPKQANNVDEDKITIVTTIFPQYDFTRQIVKDKANVIMLLKPGAESHTYEPTPQDIKTIQEADLFIYTGGENDVWIESIFEGLEKQPHTLKLIDVVHVVEEELVEGMQHDHDHDHGHGDHDHGHKEDDHSHDDHNHSHDEHEHDEHNHSHDEHEHGDHDHNHDKKQDAPTKSNVVELTGEIDEHVWTSVVNAMTIVESITEELVELDEKNKDFYLENSKNYLEELKAVDAQIKDVVKNSKSKTVIFGDRFPFRYFADEYGLEYYAAFSGCSNDSEASAATVSFLIDKVQELQVPVVFTIELSNEKIADSIVEATNTKKLVLNSAHNVTPDEFEQGITYVDIMKQNVEVLKKALN